MIKQVKDQIEQSKKVLKILESEELEQIARRGGNETRGSIELLYLT
jgi:hypothetical protein